MNDILGTLAGVTLILSTVWLIYSFGFSTETPRGYYYPPLFLFLFGLIILVAAYK